MNVSFNHFQAVLPGRNPAPHYSKRHMRRNVEERCLYQLRNCVSMFGSRANHDILSLLSTSGNNWWDFAARVSGVVTDVNEAEGQDDGTVVVSSRRSGRRKEVRIQRHVLGRKYYFVNASGSKVDTTKREWKRVEDGYELQGQRHVYFTRKFP